MRIFHSQSIKNRNNSIWIAICLVVWQQSDDSDLILVGWGGSKTLKRFDCARLLCAWQWKRIGGGRSSSSCTENEHIEWKWQEHIYHKLDYIKFRIKWKHLPRIECNLQHQRQIYIHKCPILETRGTQEPLLWILCCENVRLIVGAFFYSGAMEWNWFSRTKQQKQPASAGSLGRSVGRLLYAMRMPCCRQRKYYSRKAIRVHWAHNPWHIQHTEP